MINEAFTTSMVSLHSRPNSHVSHQGFAVSIGIVSVVVGWTILAATALAEQPYQIAWSQQLGTSDDDKSNSVSVDATGNIFISGATQGSLGGTIQGFYDDAFLSKYSDSGELLWTRQLGTSEDEESYSLAVDAVGNAFISGVTRGSLAGSNLGYADAFISKYDTSGTLLWSGQLGTSATDVSWSIAVDTTGNAIITGSTWGDLGGTNQGYHDVFVCKYSESGTLLWSRQFGTSASDISSSVAVDATGNIFISGLTLGALAAPDPYYTDAFLCKYSSSGTLLWTQQLGTSAKSESNSVAVDATGNAYISGYTNGDLGGTNQGLSDAFLSKYDTSGTLLWTRQLGTSQNDESYSVAIDSIGNAFISGYTDGALEGANQGPSDAFLSKYDTSGTLLWTRQLGTSQYDVSNSVAVDEAGNAYISGYTRGDLCGTNQGLYDAFLIKLAVPEPSSITLVACIAVASLLWRKRQR